jgi:hypothetical protein
LCLVEVPRPAREDRWLRNCEQPAPEIVLPSTKHAPRGGCACCGVSRWTTLANVSVSFGYHLKDHSYFLLSSIIISILWIAHWFCCISGAEVSDCGSYLLLTPQRDCRDNLLFFADLRQLSDGPQGPLELTQIVDKFEADYEV